MLIKNLQKNRGFVILFSVTLASILLAIALGVLSIALKEVRFSTNAGDTNNAFFAADSGVEYALFQDKDPDNYKVPGVVYSFIRPGLGSTGLGCANVTVTKDNTTDPPHIITTIVSKGYDIGNVSCTSNPEHIERELRVTYSSGS